MVTFCNDFAAAQNQNLICIPNRADTLRDDELRTAAVRGFHRLPNPFFRQGIDCTGAVIKNNDIRVLNQRSCDGNTLLLSTRNIDTPLPQLRIILIGQFHNKIMRLRRFCRRNDLLIGCIKLAPLDIFTN